MDAPFLSQQAVTDLLAQWSQGDDTALAKLTPFVYEELRRVAHHYLSGRRRDHTLQTTALVNEAYLRLADQTNPQWQDRAHFFAVAARAMRQILVGYARTQQAQKRGGGAVRVDLDEAALVSPEESRQIVELHEAQKSGALYTHHFNIMRRVMEQTACFFGYENWHQCIKPEADDPNGTVYKRVIDLMSHGDYSLYEPREMMQENKEHFARVLRQFISHHPFSPTLFPGDRRTDTNTPSK